MDKWEQRKEPAKTFLCHTLNTYMEVNESCVDCGKCGKEIGGH